MELIKNDVKVEWEELGEGISGDYNPDDPEDVELLRFSIFLNSRTEGWQYIEDSSYCTNFPVSAPYEVKVKGLELIMDRVYERAHAGLSIKRICEELSWISPQWVEEVMKG